MLVTPVRRAPCHASPDSNTRPLPTLARSWLRLPGRRQAAGRSAFAMAPGKICFAPGLSRAPVPFRAERRVLNRRRRADGAAAWIPGLAAPSVRPLRSGQSIGSGSPRTGHRKSAAASRTRLISPAWTSACSSDQLVTSSDALPVAVHVAR